MDDIIYKNFKVIYTNRKVKYFEEFSKEYLLAGLNLGTIAGFRKMNIVEKLLFKNRIIKNDKWDYLKTI